MLKILVGVAIVTSLSLSRADSKADAKKQLAIAAKAYEEKRWQDVLDALGKAYEIDPRPELHFSIGQVYVKMDRCADAIGAYDKFLASKPGADEAQIAQEAIDSCKAKLPPPAPAPIVVPPEPKPLPRDHWYSDKLGVGLVGGGAALTLVGITFYVLAKGTVSDADDAPTYGEQQDLFDSAKTKRLVSVVFTLAGAATLGVGIVHYVKKRPADRVGVAPTRDGGFITWTGRF